VGFACLFVGQPLLNRLWRDNPRTTELVSTRPSQHYGGSDDHPAAKEDGTMYELSVHHIAMNLWRWEIYCAGALLRCGTAPTRVDRRNGRNGGEPGSKSQIKTR
jgi:hypothetical protein